MTPDSVRANRRILIVDDTASIHQDFRKILCAEGEPSLENLEEALFGTPTKVRQAFELDSAYQGQEALALAEQGPGRQRALCHGLH